MVIALTGTSAMAAPPTKPGRVTNLTAAVTKPADAYVIDSSWTAASNTTGYRATVTNSLGAVLDSTTVSTTAWTAHVTSSAGVSVRVNVTPVNGRRKGATTSTSVTLPDLTAPTGTYTSSWTGFQGTLTETSLTDDSSVAGISRVVEWGDGSPTEAWSTGTTLVHTYGAQGVYYPTVTLKDQAGNTRNVQASNMVINDTTAPDGAFTVSSTSAWTKVTSVNLTQTALSDDMSAVVDLTRVVDWGDGTAPESWTTGLTLAHTYAVAGTFTPSVLIADESHNQKQVGAQAVTVTTDAVAPVVKLTLPRVRVKSLATWKVLRGKATDTAGTGVTWVRVRAVEKRGARWFGYRPATKTWVKRTTKVGAFRAGRPATVTTDALHRWKVQVYGLRLGTLVYQVTARDLSGNISKAVTHRAVISRS